jgi:hypothetical protein
MSILPKGKDETIGLAGLMELTLSGNLRGRPAGRLMQRIIREHPQASMEEALRLFRDAAINDLEVFEDVLTEVFNRHPSRSQEGREVAGKAPRRWGNVREVTWRP